MQVAKIIISICNFFSFQRIHCSRRYLATVHKCYFSGLIPDAAAGCAGVDVEEVKEGST